MFKKFIDIIYNYLSHTLIIASLKITINKTISFPVKKKSVYFFLSEVSILDNSFPVPQLHCYMNSKHDFSYTLLCSICMTYLLRE